VVLSLYRYIKFSHSGKKTDKHIILGYIILLFLFIYFSTKLGQFDTDGDIGKGLDKLFGYSLIILLIGSIEFALSRRLNKIDRASS